METEKEIKIEATNFEHATTAMSIVVKEDKTKEGAYALRGKAQLAGDTNFYISGPYTGVAKDELSWTIDTIANSLKTILVDKL